MPKMTEQQIFARMSGHFLCQHLPDDWADWPEEKLDKFFEEPSSVNKPKPEALRQLGL